MTGSTIRRWGLLAAMAALSVGASASIQQTKIAISRALNSPTLAVKYDGANAALIEMRINGESFGTRTVSDSSKNGETTFSLDLLALKDGENEVEIRLFDKGGKLLATQKATITAGENVKAPIFLSSPKVGESVAGPVEITVGFGKEFKNSYVSFFIDDQFKSMSNFPPYTYLWDTSRETNGWHDVEAWVVDETSSTFKTRKTRVFVNNPGGRTERVFKAEPVAPKTSAPAPKTKPAATAKPAPKKIDLDPTANVVAPKVGPAAKAKAAPTKASQPVGTAAQPIAPALSPIEAGNGVSAFTEPMAGMKPVSTPTSIEVSPRLLTPTGKRVVAPVVKAAPKTNAPAAKPVAKPFEKPVAAPAEGTISMPNLAPSLSPGSAMKPIALGSTESAISVPSAMTPKAPIAKPIAKPAAKTIPVVVGAKLPIKKSFSIKLNGEMLEFDVAPRMEAGVPVAPLRHLIQRAGGNVKWQNEDKSVEAFIENRTIWLKVGDKVAKIDSLPVELELAPFLESGRTIIPLSFVREALKVEIDYDLATGHVLITKAK